jgi:hypothetical protein
LKTTAARDPITQAQMDAIVPHPAWSDGRIGYLFCRFDALLTFDARHLRAEVTWLDNAEDVPSETPLTYCNPELWIETNRLEGTNTLRTHDGVKFDLTTAQALALVQSDPRAILDSYAQDIVNLSTF